MIRCVVPLAEAKIREEQENDFLVRKLNSQKFEMLFSLKRSHNNIKITEKYYILVFPDNKSKTVSLLVDFVI